MDAGAHDLLGQAAFAEELLQQRIVGFRDVLDELLVPGLDLRPQLPGCRHLFVLARAVGGIGADLAAQHVQHLVEAGPRIHRHLHRKHLGAESLADFLEQQVEINVFLVERIDDDDLGDAELVGVVPHHLRADPDAVRGVDHDDRQIHDPEGIERLAAEIEVSRRVEHVEPAALPLEAERRGMDRDLPLLFAHMVIRHRRPLHNAAHPMDHATAHEHGFRQHGLAGGCVTDDREVANIRRLVGFHRRVV